MRRCVRAFREGRQYDKSHHADHSPLFVSVPAAGLRAVSGRGISVDYDEEPIDSNSRLARLRVCAFVHLPVIGMQGPLQQMVPIEPAKLNALLEQDSANSARFANTPRRRQSG